MTSKEELENRFKNGKEALEYIRYLFYGDYPKGTPFGELEAIEKDLDRLEKLEKVNGILKKKWVLIFRLFRTSDAGEYNTCINEEYKLTQEEYELLKEVLEDEE